MSDPQPPTSGSAARSVGRTIWVWLGIPAGFVGAVVGLDSPALFLLGMTAVAVALAWLRRSRAAGWLGATLLAGMAVGVVVVTRNDVEGLYLFSAFITAPLLAAFWALVATLVGSLSARYGARATNGHRS